MFRSVIVNYMFEKLPGVLAAIATFSVSFLLIFAFGAPDVLDCHPHHPLRPRGPFRPAARPPGSLTFTGSSVRNEILLRKSSARAGAAARAIALSWYHAGREPGEGSEQGS